MAQNKLKDKAFINDFQTPNEFAKYMVSLLPEGIVTVLEPTPGLGEIVDVLEDHLYVVEAPADYWALDKKQRFDAIVGNPPFSGKTWFNAPPEFAGEGMIVTYEQLPILMSMSDHLILLLPWFTISDSDVRLRMFKDFGLVSITLLPRRTFNYTRIQTIVMQLQKGHIGNSEFIIYDRLKD